MEDVVDVVVHSEEVVMVFVRSSCSLEPSEMVESGFEKLFWGLNKYILATLLCIWRTMRFLRCKLRLAWKFLHGTDSMLCCSHRARATHKQTDPATC